MEIPLHSRSSSPQRQQVIQQGTTSVAPLELHMGVCCLVPSQGDS
eukprot:COSAG02_NODE_90_length_37755_cov_29.833364_5_plen_45_part_00